MIRVILFMFFVLLFAGCASEEDCDDMVYCMQDGMSIEKYGPIGDRAYYLVNGKKIIVCRFHSPMSLMVLDKVKGEKD